MVSILSPLNFNLYRESLEWMNKQTLKSKRGKSSSVTAGGREIASEVVTK